MGPEQSAGHDLLPPESLMAQSPTPEEPIIDDIFHQIVREAMNLKMSQITTKFNDEARDTLVNYLAGQLAEVEKQAHGHLNNVSTLVDPKEGTEDTRKPVMVMHVTLGETLLVTIEPPDLGDRKTDSTVTRLTRNIFTASLLTLQRGINSDKEYGKRKAQREGKKD